MNMIDQLRHYLPILDWGSKYNSMPFTSDLIVAGVGTVLRIPN